MKKTVVFLSFFVSLFFFSSCTYPKVFRVETLKEEEMLNVPYKSLYQKKDTVQLYYVQNTKSWEIEDNPAKLTDTFYLKTDSNNVYLIISKKVAVVKKIK